MRSTAGSASAARAAPTREDRKGSRRLPSPVVPSAKSTMASPAARRCATAALASAVAARRARSMNTERCRLAQRPNTGQAAISDFATKEIGRRLPITGMSSQETWFDRTSVGVGPGAGPRTVTRTPNRPQDGAVEQDGQRPRERPAPTAAEGDEGRERGEQRERGSRP